MVHTTPGVLDLMKLRGHAYALVQVRRGKPVPGAVLVSRRLGVWRLPTPSAHPPTNSAIIPNCGIWDA